MNHSPAFWVAFFLALFLIFDGWRTLRMMDKFSDAAYDKSNMRIRVALVSSLGLILLGLAIAAEAR